MDLSIIFNNVHFPNPTVLASGVLGVTGNSLKHVAENGAGGVTSKSIWLEEHLGHPNPTMMGNEHFLLMLWVCRMPESKKQKKKWAAI